MHTEHLFRVHLYYWWALDFHIAPCVLPIGVLLDLFHVLLDLEMNGKGLIDVVCGNTAIGCDAQHTVFFGRSGGSGDHAHVSAIHGFDSGGMPI